MKNTLLVLGAIAILILLALLYYNSQEAALKYQQQHQQYADSLRRHELYQAGLKANLERTKAAKLARERTDSAAARRYAIELGRMQKELKLAKTPRVDQIISAEPELRWYLVRYDSLLDLTQLRVDSLELEKRVKAQMYQQIIDKTNAILLAKDGEIVYLRGEIDKKQRKTLGTKLKEIGKAVGAFGLGFIFGKSSG